MVACTGPAKERPEASSARTGAGAGGSELLPSAGEQPRPSTETSITTEASGTSARNRRISSAVVGSGAPAGGGGVAGTAGGGAGGGAAGTATAVRGVTASELHVGVRYVDRTSLQAYNAATAREAGEAPDIQAQAQAVIDDLNRSGGIAGRKVVAHFRAETADSLAKPAEADSAACAFFAEQERVFAVVAVLPAPNIVFGDCMAKHSVLFLESPNASVDAKILDAWKGSAYLPGTPEATRMAAFWYSGLARTGWYAKGAAAGVFYFDDPYGINRRTVEQTLVPLLRSEGIDVRAVERQASVTDAQEVVQHEQKMQEAGVDHVMILDVSSLLSTLFMNVADKKLYFPEYGLTSFSMGGYLGSAVPPTQFEHVTLVSWLTAFDVAPAQLPPPSPQEAECARIVKAGGGGELSSAMSRGAAYVLCDVLWLLRRGADGATTLDASGFQAAVDTIGPWRGTGTYQARLGRDRYDGPSAIRVVEYKPSCRCLDYITPLQEVG
jgi:ABC-type branched-subunit amino acid transport system substrate-binding protein